MLTHRPWLWAAAVILAAFLGTLWSPGVQAASHSDAPLAALDRAADITDIYAFVDRPTDRLTVIIGFDGLRAPVAGQAGTYDPDVLYQVHIDNNRDATPDINIDIRFGRSRRGASGIRVLNLPGAGGPIAGPVERVLSGGGTTKVFAGLRDDPFFFDFQGFNTTGQTGTLSFDNRRDSIAGTNVTAIVLDMSLAAALGGRRALEVWASTARKRS